MEKYLTGLSWLCLQCWPTNQGDQLHCRLENLSLRFTYSVPLKEFTILFFIHIYLSLHRLSMLTSNRIFRLLFSPKVNKPNDKDKLFSVKCIGSEWGTESKTSYECTHVVSLVIPANCHDNFAQGLHNAYFVKRVCLRRSVMLCRLLSPNNLLLIRRPRRLLNIRVN